MGSASDTTWGPEDGTTETVQGPSLGSEPAFSIDGDAEFLGKAAAKGWSGKGTSSDPYIIEGYTFNGTRISHAISISHVSYHFIVRGNRFEGGNESAWAFGKALYLENVTCEVQDNWFSPYVMTGLYFLDAEIVVRNNTFDGSEYNIFGAMSESLIASNTFHVTGLDAIYLFKASSDIVGNTMVGAVTARAGMYLAQVPSFNATGNDISGFESGMVASIGDAPIARTSIRDNVIHNCTAGIQLGATDGASILNNTISSDERGDALIGGIYCDPALDLVLKDNRLHRCGFDIEMWDTGPGSPWQGHTIDSTNTIDSIPIAFIHDRSGVDLDGTSSEYIVVNCTNVTMVDRTVMSSFFGLLAWFVEDLDMTGNFIGTAMRNVINLYSCENADITHNPMLNNTEVRFSNGYMCEFSNNTLSDGSMRCGGTFIVMADNILENTTASGAITVNGWHDLEVLSNKIYFKDGLDFTSGLLVTGYGSSSITHCTIKGNELWGGGGYCFEDFEPADLATLEIDDTNLVNGEPLAFRSREENVVVGQGYAQVVIVKCANVTIDGLRLNRTTCGVHLLDSLNVTVSNCTFDGTMDCAILCERIGSSALVNNTMTGGDAWMRIEHGRDVRIEGNSFSDVYPSRKGEYVPLLDLYYCDRILFDGNTMDDVDSSGVYLDNTNHCTFTNNSFGHCRSYAIEIGPYSGQNRFSLNSFIENNRKEYENGSVYYVQCRHYYESNTWDNGTYGNYWSDYQARYPLATNDGYVWDEAYTYGTGMAVLLDRYPLAVPYDHTPPVVGPMDDICIGQHGTADLTANATDDVGITGYTWTFDQGGEPVVLDGKDQSFQFHRAGEFEVWLVVRDHWNNTARGSLTVFVWDLEPPVLSGIEDITVPQGTLVGFDASRCEDNIGVHDVAWSFTYDGRRVDLQGTMAEFLFERPGEYGVTISVSDLAGNRNSTTFVVTVLDTEPPIARLGGDAEVDQGTTLLFTGRDSTDNVGIVRYEWYMTSDVMTDEACEGLEFVHNFTRAGSYEVTLTITDASGLRGSATVRVRALDTEPPVARAGEDVTVEPGTEVTFDMSASTDNVGIVTWSWSLVYDGRLTEVDTPVLTFLFGIEGRYVVNLTVGDARGNEGHDEVLVRVQDTVPPVAVAGEDVSVDQRQEFALDGSGSSDDRGVVAWKWTLERAGRTDTFWGARPTIVLDEAGVYTVTLTVTDGAGNAATDTVLVHVRDIMPPVANAGPDRTVDQSAPIRLDGGLSTDNVLVSSYSWTFGYGGEPRSLSGKVVEFTFDDPGVYTIALTVEDAGGLSSSDEMVLTVLDTEPPVAMFSMDPDDLRVGEGTAFTFNGHGSTDNVAIAEWTWTVSHDGVETTEHDPILRYRFDGAGNYTVRLEVKDHQGLAGAKEVTIQVVGEPADGGRSYYIIGAVGMLALLVVVGLIMWSGKRKARSPP